MIMHRSPGIMSAIAQVLRHLKRSGPARMGLLSLTTVALAGVSGDLFRSLRKAILEGSLIAEATPDERCLCFEPLNDGVWKMKMLAWMIHAVHDVTGCRALVADLDIVPVKK